MSGTGMMDRFRRTFAPRNSRTAMACTGIWFFCFLATGVGSAISLAETGRPEFHGMDPSYRLEYETGFDLLARMGEMVRADSERPGGWWETPEERSEGKHRKVDSLYAAAFGQPTRSLLNVRMVAADDPSLSWRNDEWNPIEGDSDLLMVIPTTKEHTCEIVLKVLTRLPFSYVASRFEMSLTPRDGGERRWRPVLQGAWPTDISPCESQFDGDRWRGHRDALSFRMIERSSL